MYQQKNDHKVDVNLVVVKLANERKYSQVTDLLHITIHVIDIFYALNLLFVILNEDEICFGPSR